jgi:hypothetical protein
MRARLVALIALFALSAADACAQAIGTEQEIPDLSGIYRCVRECSGPGLIRIAQVGSELGVVNELGQRGRGWIKWPGRIWLESWQEGAVYSPTAFTIQFDRGTVWVLLDPAPIPGAHYNNW